MRALLLLLALVFAAPVFGQSGGTDVIVETVAELSLRRPRSGGELVSVRNYSTNILWSVPRLYVETTATNAHDGLTYVTNASPSANSRYVSHGPLFGFGYASPEGAVPALPGSLFSRVDATNAPVFYKNSGSGSSGWLALGSGSSFSFSDLTNSLLMGANMSAVYTSTNMTISSSGGGGGATNGTAITVDSGSFLSTANFADSSRVGFSVSGTNVTADIVSGSIRTNELDAAALSYLTAWTSLSGVPSFVSDLAGATGSAGTLLYFDGTFLQELALGTSGQVLTVSGSAPAWADPTGGGGSTNGTPVSVDGSLLSAANFADGARIGFSASGTNVTADIVAGSVRTNELATAAISYLTSWSSLTGTPTTLSGYGITDAQGLNPYLTDLSGMTGLAGTMLYFDGVNLSPLAVGTNGQVLTLSGTTPGWATPSGGGSGTVTSVGLTVPAGFSVSGSPVTTSGTLAVSGVLAASAGGTGITNTTPAGQALLSAVDEVDQLTLLTLIGGTPTDIDSNARVLVRKNSGTDVGTRRRLNFIEGTNTSLTITDDAGNEEIDIIVASTATAGSTNATYTTNYLTVPLFVADTTNEVAVANTTETNLLTSIASWGSTNIALGTLPSGTTLRFRAGGTFSGPGDWDGGDLRFKVGGLTVTGEFTDADSLTPAAGSPWSLDVDLLVVSAGSSAVVAVSGGLRHYYSAPASSVSSALQPLTISGTLDTTTNNTVGLTFQNNTGQGITLIRNTATLEHVGKESILGGGSGSGGGTTNLVSSSAAGLAPQATLANAVLGTDGSTNVAWTARSTRLLAWTALENNPPTNASSAALFALRGDGIPALVFTNNTAREANFTGWLPSGVTLTNGLDLVVGAYSEGNGGASNVVLQAQIMRLCCTGSGALDTNAFLTASLATSTLPTTVSVATNITISMPTITDLTAGEMIRVQLTRVVGSASDTNDFNLGVLGARLEAR